MYIIAIAWLYVALLVAIADTSIVGGILTFLLMGLGPLALFLWLFGTPARHRRKPPEAPPPDPDEGGGAP
ncbi:MAG: hypothetical protein KDG55_16720 [Rhodocyclaceae bacterium]|nr:hypothetical protein [Rhodocyclaceae bacterium]